MINIKEINMDRDEVEEAWINGSSIESRAIDPNEQKYPDVWYECTLALHPSGFDWDRYEYRIKLPRMK